MDVDYDDHESIWTAIPDGWWLNSKTSKFMLVCLVHKDNVLSIRTTKIFHQSQQSFLLKGPTRMLIRRRKRKLRRVE